MVIEIFDYIFSNPYLIGIHSLNIIGIITFLFIPKDLKKRPVFFIAFLILLTVSFYEFFGTYTIVDRGFNESMHHLISNVPYKGWNLWAFNIFRFQISLILIIGWTCLFIENQKFYKVLIYLLMIFIGSSIFLELTKIQEITGFQPIIYFMGYVLGITACCLFFLDLISSNKYLLINPLRFIPFWFITFNLFQNVILFLADIASEYLVFKNVQIYHLFNYISQVLYLLMLFSIVVIFINQGLFIEKKAKTA